MLIGHFQCYLVDTHSKSWSLTQYQVIHPESSHWCTQV